MSQQRIKVWVQKRESRPFLSLEWVEPSTGRRRCRSAKTADAKTAEKMRGDLEYELNNGLKEPRKITWEKFRRLFEDEHLGGIRPSSFQPYQSAIVAFERIASVKHLGQITERVLSKFVAGLRTMKSRQGRPLAAATIHSYVVMLRVAFRWAKDQGFLADVPKFPKVRMMRLRPRPIRDEDFDKLLTATDNLQFKAFMLCAWYGGLRLNEAYQLRRSKSDEFPWVDAKAIIFPARFVKSNEDQFVPLHDRLREALRLVKDDKTGRYFNFVVPKTKKCLSLTALSHRVSTLARSVGVNLTMHQLRKGFGCRLASTLGTGGTAVVHRLMRHSNMQITMDYYANVDDVLKEHLDKI